MDIYVLNNYDMSIEGVIDEYVSCIWRPSYSEIGDFELYMGARPELIELLVINRYLVRNIDIKVLNGVVTYKKVMVIKNIELITNSESGNFLRVTGRELKFILNQRIIWTQTNLSGTAESGIRQLITENAIQPTDNKRTIPNLELDSAIGFSDQIKKQVTGDMLADCISEICITYDYGFDVYIQDDKLRFTLYKGTNRAYGQSDRPYVIFSDKFDNLIDTDYQLNSEMYATTTLIGGEGEGTERVYTTVGADISGLSRYEVFTDARDLSQNKGTEAEIALEDYVELLAERGIEALKELSYTEGFSGEVITDSSFKFEKDFFLGDTVTIINSYGIIKNVKVLSAIESDDKSGFKLIPQFNI